MAVTQYIGARYVPLLAEPVEWNSTREYEPLTIVLNEGNSFTSRQFVPVGIDIDNEVYWAATGNYNAQVELYRQETARAQSTASAAQDDIDTLLPKTSFDSTNTVKKLIDDAQTAADNAQDDIDALLPKASFDSTNTVKKYLDALNENVENNLNKSYVGNYGAIEDSNNNDWDTIIADIAEVSDTIYFGSGSWNLGSGISIPNTIKNVVGNGCKLYPNGTTNILVECNYANTSVSGLYLDGRGMCDELLHMPQGNTKQVINCNFVNIGTGNIGICNEYVGLVCVGCSFNVVSTNDASRVTGGIGIKTHTDNQIVACKFFHLDYAILARGVNVGNCYFWTSEEVLGVVLAPEEFLTDRTVYIFDAIFTNCEFDCIQRLVINPRNVSVLGCQFYWNNRDLSTKTPILFSVASSYNFFDSISVNYNIIKTQEISYDIYQFGKETDSSATTIRLRNYNSRENLVSPTTVYNTRGITHYHMLLGVNWYNYAPSSTYPYVLSPVVAVQSSSTRPISNWIYDFEHNKKILFSRYENSVCTLIRPQPHPGINDYITGYTDATNVIEYIPIHPLAISSIYVCDSAPINIQWRADRSIDDFDPTDLTQVTSYIYQVS